MTARFTLPFRRMGVLFTVFALALGLTAALSVSPPAAHAAVCNDVYGGAWTADDPHGDLTTIAIDFPSCPSFQGTKVFVFAHPWLGLGDPNRIDYWGYSTEVTWGYVGTSLTVVFRFQGLTESLYIVPTTDHRLRVVQTETYSNSPQVNVRPTQYFHHAG